jgi:hypothetical protein
VETLVVELKVEMVVLVVMLLVVMVDQDLMVVEAAEVLPQFLMIH